MLSGVMPAEVLVLAEVDGDQAYILRGSKEMAEGGLIPGTMATDGGVIKEGKEIKMIMDGPYPSTSLLRLDDCLDLRHSLSL